MITALTDGCSARGNEDRFGYAAGAAWVLDGATDISGTDLAGRTAAWWLVEAFQAELQGRLGREQHEDAAILAQRLADGARRRLEAAFPSFIAALEQASTAFSLVRRVAEGWSVLCLADCPVLYRDPATGRIASLSDPGFSPVERRSLDALSAARQCDPDASLDQLVRAVRPVLQANRTHKNVAGGYAVGAITPPPPAMLFHRTLPPSVDAFVILSDGFSRWYDLFGLGSAEDLFARVEDGAAPQLLDELRAAERADPEGRQFLRFKTHDDATCLYVQAAEL